MGKKEKIYEDENGKKYILKNGEREYVIAIDSCVDFFGDTEAEEDYFKEIIENFKN